MSGNAKKTPEAVRKSLTVTVVEAKGLSAKSADKPNLYCVVSVNNVHYNTNTSERAQKPEWKQKFTFAEAAIQPKDAQLRVILFNKQGVKDTVIGEADINLNDISPNQPWKEWHGLGDEKGKAKVLLDIYLVADTPTTQKRKNRMNESLTRRISWGAKQTSSASVVSPSKKVVEESSSDSEDGGNSKAKQDAANGTSAEPSKRKRAATFDFVGTGTDAETYEDQFKQAYHDETDMEDAFATDDAKPVMDDSDAEDGPKTAVDHTDKSANGDEAPNKAEPTDKNGDPSEAPAAAATATEAAAIEPQPNTNDDANKAKSEPAGEGEEAPAPASVPSTPTKGKKSLDSKKNSKAKMKKHKGKANKPMDALHEEAEESDSQSHSMPASAPATPANDTPSRKKSSFMGFLKRLGGGKSQKPGKDETGSGSAAQGETSSADQHIDEVGAASTSGGPPATPRGSKSAAKIDVYEAMKAELKSHVEMERAFIQDLNMLLDEYLRPAKTQAVPIEHVAVLCAPVEQMIAHHSETLKLVEKKYKGDQFAVGTAFDDLLAAVSDAYKLYRSKQVLLLSLLDSSPTEKSMADHVAISSWIEARLEANQADLASGKARQLPPLQELVLEPMHRLAGISFLLEQLTVVAPQTHGDFPNIRKASARISLLLQELFMRGTTYRSMAKLNEIDAMLEFPYGVPSFQLADESAKRSYLLEGPVYHLEQHNATSTHSEFSKIYFFLFSDMLLMCKQLARDTSAQPSSTKHAKRNAASRQNSATAATSSSVVRRLSSGVHTSGHHYIQSPANKYIVLSRLALDRVFLVDPEETGEMSTYANAKSKKFDSEDASTSNAAITNATNAGDTATPTKLDLTAASPSTASTTATPSKPGRASVEKAPKSPRTPRTPRGGKSNANSSPAPKVDAASPASRKDVPTIVENVEQEGDDENVEEIEELKEVDRLLEIVDMGVAIHRLRFVSREDKKLWMATLNSAFSNVKLSFGVNERQYLYKLLVATQPCKPILLSSASYDGEPAEVAAWPSARFIASSATRQLIERLHSHTLATTIHFQQQQHNSRPISSTSTDSETALIKQEVTLLKREHLRQLAELAAQHDKDQAEIENLKKDLKAKDEALSAAQQQNRQSRSNTVESVDSNMSVSVGGSTGKRKKKPSDDALSKHLEKLEARDAEMFKKMEMAEFMMKSQTEQFTRTMQSMTRELEEMRSERKAMMQQQDRLAALLDRSMLNSLSSSSNSTALSREPSSDKPQPGTVAAARESVIRQTSGISGNNNKPIVPAKPSTIGGAGASNSQAGKFQSGAPSRQQSGWRGSAPAPSQANANHSPSTLGSGGGSATSLSSGTQSPSAAPNPTLIQFGAKGKRPSSVSLIAAVPLEQAAPHDAVADSSESSGPRAGSLNVTTSGGSGSGSGAPNTFGSSGKSPSRLNLTAAAAAQPPGSPSTEKHSPVSPGGRGKERKVKNLRFPNGEGEPSTKGSGNWLKKLGLSSAKDKPRREESSGQLNTSWRQTPAPTSAGNQSDAPITVKKANKVDWSQARAEAYLSDDLGSDYDPAMAMTQSDFERAQEEFLAPDNDGSDYSDEGEH